MNIQGVPKLLIVLQRLSHFTSYLHEILNLSFSNIYIFIIKVTKHKQQKMLKKATPSNGGTSNFCLNTCLIVFTDGQAPYLKMIHLCCFIEKGDGKGKGIYKRMQ